LDREVVQLPAWVEGGRLVLEDAKLGALYRLGEGEVEVVAGPGWLRTAAMRVVRELATSSALVCGDRVQLHAAVLACRGRGLAVAGPKGAGKTTLLGYLAGALREQDARIVTNDRALARVSRSHVEVAGVPTIVSVRPGSLAWLPQLARGLPDVERIGHLRRPELEAALAEHGPLAAPRRLKLSPPQLAGQLGVPLAARASLDAIVFPEAGAAPDGLALERLDRDAAGRRLAETLFGVHSGRTGPTEFERRAGAARPADADARGLEAVAARVPCFSLRFGHERYADDHAARSILQATLGA
jgi:energy-coupling factor transporter ATP-binding protein EcfA2